MCKLVNAGQQPSFPPFRPPFRLRSTATPRLPTLGGGLTIENLPPFLIMWLWGASSMYRKKMEFQKVTYCKKFDPTI
jgi:hypothetical protein